MLTDEKLKAFKTEIPRFEIFAFESALKIKGTPLVLLHGAVASHRYMMPTAKLLADDYRILVPDLPGHGYSSKPAHALSAREHATVLKDWVEAIGVEKIHLLANSYGCQIASHFAVDFPQLLDKLILTDSTGDPEAPTAFKQFVRLCQDALVEPPFAPLMMFLDIYNMGWKRTFETADRMVEDDIKVSLPKIKAKTLVIRGEYDPISTLKWNEEMVRLIPDAQFDQIPHAPHSVNSATAPALSALVRDFLG